MRNPHPATFVVTSLILGLFSVCFIQPLEAVMFAHDTIILYENDQLILDSGVICTNAGGQGSQVCHRGILILDQHEGKRTFYRTVEKAVQSFSGWAATFGDYKDAILHAQEWHQYMDNLKAQAEYSVVLSFSGAKGGMAGPAGGTGGRIGNPRTFQVDLRKGTVVQIQDSSLPRDLRNLVNEVREKNQRGQL